MALQRGITDWVDSGQTTAGTDVDGLPITVPLLSPVRNGEWQYTDAGGSVSVCCDSAQTQLEAEASRDTWLAAGGTV